jgi:hypothetical protein
LAEACHLLLDPDVPDESLRKKVFAKIPRAALENALERVTVLIRPPDDVYYQELSQHYRSVRGYLPHVLLWQILETGLTILWKNQAGRVHVGVRSLEARICSGGRNWPIDYGRNQKLTKVIAGRTIKAGTVGPGGVLLLFDDQSSMKIKTAGPAAIPPGGKVKCVHESRAEFKIDFEDGSSATLQLADPGSSVAVRDKNNAVEYLG